MVDWIYSEIPIGVHDLNGNPFTQEDYNATLIKLISEVTRRIDTDDDNNDYTLFVSSNLRWFFESLPLVEKSHPQKLGRYTISYVSCTMNAISVCCGDIEELIVVKGYGPSYSNKETPKPINKRRLLLIRK